MPTGNIAAQNVLKRKEEGEEGDQGLAEALADSDDERVSARSGCR